MRKWFLSQSATARKKIFLMLWLTVVVCFALIIAIPLEGDPTFVHYVILLGFLGALVILALFYLFYLVDRIGRLFKGKHRTESLETILAPAETIQKDERTVVNVSARPMLTFFDVETPTRKNDKICSIGLVVCQDGHIVLKQSILVNPEVAFDAINTRIHGITAQMVAKEPNLPTIWNRISHYFTDGIVVGHAIRTDLNVLKKALGFYGITIPTIQYIDTLTLAQKYLDRPSYKLADLCAELRPGHQAHDALSDCLDCKALYDMLVNRLDVSPYELAEEFYIERSLKETSVDHSEPVDKLSDTTTTESIETDVFDGNFENKLFCLTGDFKYGPRPKVEEYILSRGGNIHPTVTRKVDYLVRGAEGSEAYAYGSYGGKVKKALENKEKGIPIKIISETDLFSKAD